MTDSPDYRHPTMDGEEELHYCTACTDEKFLTVQTRQADALDAIAEHLERILDAILNDPRRI